MDRVQVTGKVLVIGEDQSFGDGGFHKRELVIETDERYPQTLAVEFTNDDADKPTQVSVGDVVTINVNIRGRAWERDGNTRYFTSLSAWGDIEVSRAIAAPAPTEQPAGVSTGEPVADADDLPF